MDKTIKEIELSWKGRNKHFMLAGVFLIGTLVLTVMFKRLMLMPLIFGIIFLIIAFSNMNLKIVQFYENHLIFQPSAFVKKMILYKNLVSYDVQNRKIIINYKDGVKIKKIYLLKEIISNDDIAVLRDMLNKKIKISRD